LFLHTLRKKAVDGVGWSCSVALSSPATLALALALALDLALALRTTVLFIVLGRIL
jgi:hypothetical protein